MYPLGDSSKPKDQQKAVQDIQQELNQLASNKEQEQLNFLEIHNQSWSWIRSRAGITRASHISFD